MADEVPEKIGEQTSSEAPKNEFVLEGLRIEVVVDEQGNEQTIVVDARGLLDDGNAALGAGEFARAIDNYASLLRDFPESSLVGPALYNTGLAQEGLGKVDAAIAQYQLLAEKKDAGRDAVDAQIRIAALHAENKQWGQSLAAIDALLATATLSSADRLEAMARKGYVLLESKDYAVAEETLQATIAFAEQKENRVEMNAGYYLGMAHFYYGDIARRQFDAIPIRLPEEQMGRDVEAKAVLTNLASDRFAATIEAGNIYWATAAGFRLAELQHSFWRSLVTAPIPPHLSKLASTIYIEEVHKHSLTFLQKALRIHSKNVQLATVYNGDTSWSRASEVEVIRLTERIGREKSGELINKVESAVIPGARHREGEYIPGRVDL